MKSKGASVKESTLGSAKVVLQSSHNRTLRWVIICNITPIGFSLKTRTTSFYWIHRKTRENPWPNHKARLQILCTWAYNYHLVHSSPLRISHGLHFHRLPIMISDRSDLKNIYAVLNSPGRSGILKCALCVSPRLRRLWLAIGGSRPENIYIVVNDPDRSSKSRWALYTSLWLRQLQYAIGEADPKICVLCLIILAGPLFALCLMYDRRVPPIAICDGLWNGNKMYCA